jgi:NADH:ubiquinone oxidoreductase subunit C
VKSLGTVAEMTSFAPITKMQLVAFAHTVHFAVQIRQALSKFIITVDVVSDRITVRVQPQYLRPLAIYFRNKNIIRAAALIDIAAVDKLNSKQRFTINYIFNSSYFGQRLVIELFASETAIIPSLSNPIFLGYRIFASAG